MVLLRDCETSIFVKVRLKALLVNPHSECSPVACSGVKLLQKPAATQQPAASIQQTGRLGAEGNSFLQT